MTYIDFSSYEELVHYIDKYYFKDLFINWIDNSINYTENLDKISLRHTSQFDY